MKQTWDLTDSLLFCRDAAARSERLDGEDGEGFQYMSGGRAVRSPYFHRLLGGMNGPATVPMYISVPRSTGHRPSYWTPLVDRNSVQEIGNNIPP